MHDTAIATAVVKPGGVILWHDYGNPTTPDVGIVLEDLRRKGRDIRSIAGSWVAYELV